MLFVDPKRAVFHRGVQDKDLREGQDTIGPPDKNTPNSNAAAQGWWMMFLVSHAPMKDRALDFAQRRAPGTPAAGQRAACR